MLAARRRAALDGSFDDVSAAASRREAGELESEVLVTLWAAGEPMMPAGVLEQLGVRFAYTRS